MSVKETHVPSGDGFVAPDLSLTTALVIEDQPAILSLISDCLRVLGVGRLVSVADARSAKELMINIQNNPSHVGVSHVDFAVVDWNLHGNPFDRKKKNQRNDKGKNDRNMQGPEICAWLRQIESCRFMPILATSAYAHRDCVIEMQDAGVNAFISKPFSIQNMCRQIHTMVSQLRPYVVTPSGFFGPDRRRKNIDFEIERRRSQNGVKKFNPPRTLRQKTSGNVEISQEQVFDVTQTMREIQPPDYIELVTEMMGKIGAELDMLPAQIHSAGHANIEDTEKVRQHFDNISAYCGEVLGNPGGFTYQMVAETAASMTRFISDNHFLPTPEAISMIRQQLATVTMILTRDMKGAAQGEMRGLFVETFNVIERVLKQNEANGISLWS